MTHPLDGARLKVVRAEQHLDGLKSAISLYIKSDPSGGVVKFDGQYVKPIVSIDEVNPPIIRTIIGDFLSNCRSALDYIVWELAVRYAGRDLVPPPAGSDKPYFPIFDDPGKCANQRTGLSKYKIPADAIREIENVQPYPGRDKALWLLHALVNSDKHRLPVLVGGQEGRTMIAVSHGGSEYGRDLKTNPKWDTSEVPDDMHVNGQVSVYVAINDPAVPRIPVERLLENIVKRVADIIPRFDRFF